MDLSTAEAIEAVGLSIEEVIEAVDLSTAEAIEAVDLSTTEVIEVVDLCTSEAIEVAPGRATDLYRRTTVDPSSKVVFQGLLTTPSHFGSGVSDRKGSLFCECLGPRDFTLTFDSLSHRLPKSEGGTQDRQSFSLILPVYVSRDFM